MQKIIIKKYVKNIKEVMKECEERLKKNEELQEELYEGHMKKYEGNINSSPSPLLRGHRAWENYKLGGIWKNSDLSHSKTWTNSEPFIGHEGSD